MTAPPAPLLAALLGTLAAGCAGPAGTTRSAPSGPPVRDLRVGLREYALALSAPALLPGQVTIAVTNAGSAPHNLRLRQGERTLGRSRLLGAGQRQTFRVQVAAGPDVVLDCTLIGHADAGMRAQLTVSSSPVSPSQVSQRSVP